MRLRRFFCPLAAALGLALALLFLQGAAAAEDLQVRIHGPGQQKVNIFLSAARALSGDNATEPPALAGEMYSSLKENLAFLPFLQSVPGEEILGKESPGGLKAGRIDFKRYVMSKVDFLLTFGFRERRGGQVQMELRVFRTRSAELFVGRGYVVRNSKQAQAAAKKFCADLMQGLTGEAGFFRSRLAFVRNLGGNKEVFTASPQGGYLKGIAGKEDELVMSPAWSWDGKRIAYVRVKRDRHELMVYNREKEASRRISLPGNTIISPAFRPDGRLVVSADPKDNPDIYLLEEGKLGQALVQSWAIDISPGFDESGRWMSFVSSRLGNPHIFLKDLRQNKEERISYEGDYNTGAAISPSGRYIAYARRTDAGHRIFIHDRKRDTTRKLTTGPGDDEAPTWGPDGYFLAFTSSRSGEYRIYIGSRHGDGVKEVDTGPGAAKGPDWGPELR
ncbi:MAG: hypothetical protein K9K39_04630 [Desulfohalobiaceae bacterium]|nr:hypothetical protein [Desulfohalobiaceae bacterium]